MQANRSVISKIKRTKEVKIKEHNIYKVIIPSSFLVKPKSFDNIDFFINKLISSKINSYLRPGRWSSGRISFSSPDWSWVRSRDLMDL